MLKYNFTYELKLLLRSRWIQLLSVILLVLFGFAAFNGQKKVDKRSEVISDAQQTVVDNDQKMVQLLDSVAQGMPVSVSRWMIPSSPMAVGNYYPRVAAMETQPMAFIATGQADLYTPYVKPTVTGDDFALNFTEMSSPVQLLFGSFDMAFVIVYLLPLLIIAFTYNILSGEKESGSLRLLMAQPIKIQTWVLQKLGLRFFWLALLVILCLFVVFISSGLDVTAHFSSIGALIALILVYMLFWFALAFLVNLWVGSSAKNAVAMLGLWVVFVLLIPSILNQAGNAMYPMPSRTLMINEMRAKKIEVAKRQDEILDNFLRDHPEYAINDTTQARTFYHGYMASQKLIKEELAPIISSYEIQLQKQQSLVGQLKWLSPALSMQQALNRLAGSSSADYENYRKQVIAFAETWRQHLIPMLYNNQEFTAADQPELPAFTYEPLAVKTGSALVPLLLIGMGLFTLGYLGAGSLRAQQKLMEA